MKLATWSSQETLEHLAKESSILVELDLADSTPVNIVVYSAAMLQRVLAPGDVKKWAGQWVRDEIAFKPKEDPYVFRVIGWW